MSSSATTASTTSSCSSAGEAAEEAAKDSADIAAFFRAGFRKNDEMKAMEVLPILKEKVAYLSDCSTEIIQECAVLTNP